MKAWYFPSHNGDLRIEPDEKDATKSRLTIVKPTAYETTLLKAMETVFRQKGWWTSPEPLWAPAKRSWLRRAQSVVTCEINGPFAEIGSIVANHTKPGLSTLTAIRFESGKVFTIAAGEADLSEAMNASISLGAALAELPNAPVKRSTPELPPAAPRAPADPVAAAAYEATTTEPAKPAKDKPVATPEPVKDKPVVAATVQRPTPCCPRCIPGAVEPASEVLLSFLTDEQHESWAKDRCIKVVGGFTGAEYLLAHRHTKRAQKIGRVCYSITDDAVVHFHQTEVPPEEEILAAKLILEHREDWLRNEATLFGSRSKLGYFKNPFGDGSDGVADAIAMEDLGSLLLGGRVQVRFMSSVEYVGNLPNPAPQPLVIT